MTDDELIRAYLATNTVTRVEPGARTMTSSQMRRALGWEPDVVMKKPLIHFHAVMLDECGDEFGAGVDAPDRETARRMLREEYPESRGIVQIESPDDTREREQRMYARIEAEMNGEFYPEDEY
jgi:hypothetical protein